MAWAKGLNSSLLLFIEQNTFTEIHTQEQYLFLGDEYADLQHLYGLWSIQNRPECLLATINLIGYRKLRSKL